MTPEERITEDIKVIMRATRTPTVAETYVGACSISVRRIVIDDTALGSLMRKEREDQNISLRAHARKLKLSAPYVSDLERGRRAWNLHRCTAYLQALPVMPQPHSLQIG